MQNESHHVSQLPKIPCNRCKYLSAMNGPAVFGTVQTQQTQHSWLVNVDSAGRPQTNLPLNARLLLIWCWACNMSQVQIKDCLNGIIVKNSAWTDHICATGVYGFSVRC